MHSIPPGGPSSSCPYKQCFETNIFKLPVHESPRVVSSASANDTGAIPLSRQSWEVIAGSDAQARYALQHAVCCYKKSTPPGAAFHVCHISDSQDKSVRLPAGCHYTADPQSAKCTCRLGSTKQLYCGSLPMLNPQAPCNQPVRVERSFECRKDGRLLFASSSLDASLPEGCSIDANF